MKPISRISIVLFIALCYACKPNQQKVADEYTCPMHPEIIRTEPGKCPVCGMNLVKKRKSSATGSVGSPDEPVGSRVTTVTSKVKSVVPERLAGNELFTANGIVAVDPRSSSVITARIDGRIEKLLLKSDGERVHKGQLLMEVYSPELISAAKSYLYVLGNDSENKLMVTQLRERLVLLGMTEERIREMVISKKPVGTVKLYSAVSGYLQLNGAFPFEEGQYITAGQDLFKVYDSSSVWIELQVDPRNASFIKAGDRVVIASDANKHKMETRVAFIQPFSNSNGFLVVRCNVSNAKGTWRPGQQVIGSFSAMTSLSIPEKAVIDLGTKIVVFVRDGNVYRAKAIAAIKGPGDRYTVTGGLHAGDSIASSAHFFLDQDSFIQTEN